LVAELNDEIVGYADLQPDGYVDQFFVAASAARQGVGRALLEAIESQARDLRIARLISDVSLAAEPFFRRFGFVVEREQEVMVRGVVLINKRMSKPLAESA
jgi:putative acetyltransferase